jgi:predicted SprT family Zn-dependent metalloprotease
MTSNDVPHIAHHLLGKYNLAQQGWVFRWDNAKRRAGACWYYRKVISLSRAYVNLNIKERPDDVIDTILHEIAHALAGCREGHSKVWKAMCARIGARPERCTDRAVMMPVGRLTATCGNCGKVFHRHKHFRHGKWCYCTACGPEQGKLVFRDSTATPASPTVAHHTDTPPSPKRLRG